MSLIVGYQYPEGMKDFIGRTIAMMGIEGVTSQDIYDALKAEGMTDYQVFLTYKAAKLVVDSRSHEAG